MFISCNAYSDSDKQMTQPNLCTHIEHNLSIVKELHEARNREQSKKYTCELVKGHIWQQSNFGCLFQTAYTTGTCSAGD